MLFLSVFGLFYRVFEGSHGERNPWYFGGFPWCFRNDQGKEGQGNFGRDLGGLADKRNPCVGAGSLRPRQGTEICNFNFRAPSQMDFLKIFQILGFGKSFFFRKGSFRKVHCLEILENVEILEILERPQTVESDHFF